jgi:hypothetical protein
MQLDLTSGPLNRVKRILEEFGEAHCSMRNAIRHRITTPVENAALAKTLKGLLNKMAQSCRDIHDLHSSLVSESLNDQTFVLSYERNIVGALAGELDRVIGESYYTTNRLLDDIEYGLKRTSLHG